MPQGSWLGLIVCAALVSPVIGLEPPPVGHSATPGMPLPHGPAVLPNEHGVKDLTPPEFADLLPHDDHGSSHGAHGTPGHLTPTVPEHAGFYGTAEYLLFRPRSAAYDYALANNTTGLVTSGPVQSLQYDMGSGFRVEAGYRFEHGWDAAFAYTYFQSSGESSIVAGPGQVLFPTLTRPGLTDTATFASALANLNYNLYDMTIGKRFAFDESFAVRAFGGFRFTDITQRLDAFYNGLDARQASVITRSSFEGFGPLIGAEAVLSGWHGLHAYARTSGGLMVGRSCNQLTETNNGGATTYVNAIHNPGKVVPVVGIAIGGGWQYRTISIRAGYEVTHWFGISEPLRFTDDVSQGKLVARPSDLSLEGLFIQLGLSF